LVARAEAGEVTYLVAVVDRVALILAERGDTRPLEVRRAAGLALLAHPGHALALLAEHAAAHAHDPDPAHPDPADPDTDPADPDAAGTDAAPGDSDGDGDAAGDAAGGDGPSARTGEGHDGPGSLLLFGDPHDDPGSDGDPSGQGGDGMPGQGLPAGGVPRPGQWSFLQVPDHLAGALRLLARPGVLDKLMPAATLYVHLDQAAVHTNTGPATVEDLAVTTAEQARRWLGHRRVTITPVIDLDAEHAPVDGYVFPRRLRQVMHLTNPRDTFPFGGPGPAGGAGKDADHVVPYVPPDEHGPPGQTGLHNGTLLGRFAHRLKTHGRWRLLQLARGVHLWHSPHGTSYLVDPLGTHPVPHAVLPWLLHAAHLDGALDAPHVGARRAA